MTEISWLLLTYKVPSDPATKRVALWRKIKGLGAVYVQNGVCMLPKTDEHVRRFKMLENDIMEMSGEAVILETAAIDPSQQEKVIARFKADRDEHYHEFLERCGDFEKEIAKETAVGKFSYAELEENDADLKKLQDWFEKIAKLDFYGASLAADAQERLRACETLLDTFAKQVFEAHEETRASASKPAEE
ncbi:chromate resistance protein ChrB [Rhizobium calliandrae]|uniref:Chromate resistance protein ChrB n=1 Tax=Rhizobium calliandrae TaxID=1312182 RepID=A0ABT7KKT4_9HYPH|nr:Chromate resistance protein ChrB [Rhizobium calliandrae]MDL2409225.1 chromate resistance protein ChrB [Rhizobium calliandrae]